MRGNSDVGLKSVLKRFRFEPIDLETTGVTGESIARSLREVGRRLLEATGDSPGAR